MTAYRHTYLQLPVNADEGFPQSFRMSVGAGGYGVALYVNVTDERLLAPPDQPLRLPVPGAFLVMAVTRDGPGQPEVLFRRKVVCQLEYAAAELAFVFTEITIDSRNLNAAGAFGSRITAGVAARWAL